MQPVTFEGKHELLQSGFRAKNMILNIKIDVGELIIDYLEENDPRQIEVSYIF